MIGRACSSASIGVLRECRVRVAFIIAIIPYSLSQQAIVSTLPTKHKEKLPTTRTLEPRLPPLFFLRTFRLSALYGSERSHRAKI